MSDTFAFKDLKVWHKAIDFADEVIGLVDNLETDRKHFRLIEQLEAASASISMNIAEGKGRNSKKEYVQFLYYSRGSLYETISLLHIFSRKKWINKETLENFEDKGLEIARMIKGLINSIR